MHNNGRWPLPLTRHGTRPTATLGGVRAGGATYSRRDRGSEAPRPRGAAEAEGCSRGARASVTYRGTFEYLAAHVSFQLYVPFYSCTTLQ